MERFEDELKRALQRKEPPAGFAGRVVTAAESARPGERKRPWTLQGLFAWPVLRWACVAVVLVALVGGFRYRARRVAERARAEQAKQELIMALRITGDKLQFVKAKVLETGGAQPVRSEIRD